MKLDFLSLRKIIVELNRKKNIYTNSSRYEDALTYLVCVSDQQFANCMDLLLITNRNTSHYVYIKDFNRFMCNKTQCKIKKHFTDIV